MKRRLAVASQGQTGGVSDHHHINRKRVYGGIDSSQRKKTVPPFPTTMTEFDEIHNICKLFYATKALEFYNKSQAVEFKLGEISFYSSADLRDPSIPAAFFKTWIHISFTATPKTADRMVVPPTYFFAELSRGISSEPFEVKDCNIFEPSNESGFQHGCMICPATKRFHPDEKGYKSGRPPYYVAKKRMMPGSFLFRNEKKV
ncbi:hypothetical protein OROGR_029169 [Orobanche gracilis]